MSRHWTFGSATAFWRAHHNADPEAVWDRFETAEAFLLDHTPTSSAEAEIIFDILLDQAPEGRSDGRDRQALIRLRNYVGSLHRLMEMAA